MNHWVFEIGDLVCPVTVMSYDKACVGVVVARELYEQEGCSSMKYYVRWSADSGTFDKDVLVHSSCELSRKETDEH